MIALLDPQFDRRLQDEAIESLLGIGAGKELVEVIPNLTPSLQKTIQTKLLTRHDWALELVKGVEAKAIHANHLMRATIQGLLNHPSADVQEAAIRVLSIHATSTDRRNIVDEYINSLSNSTNVSNGKLLSKEPEPISDLIAFIRSPE